MPEKKLAAFVEASRPPSEPAAKRTRQPVSVSAPLSARTTCAEPPRGKKNSPEQTQPPDRPTARTGRAPFPPAPRSAIQIEFGRGAGDPCPTRAHSHEPSELPACGGRPTRRQVQYRSERGSISLRKRFLSAG